jgi:hypothetical protein
LGKNLLILVPVLDKVKQIEDEQDGKTKNRKPLRRAEPVRFKRLAFMISFAASQGGVKGTKLSIRG